MPYSRPKLSRLRDVDSAGRADDAVIAWNEEEARHVYREVTLESLAAAAASHTHGQADIHNLADALNAKADASDLTAHTASTSNPHSVTKSQVGLGNVSNDAQLKVASNLSDLNDVATARSNLGIPPIDTSSTANALPQADGSGKIANGWLNTGSGNGLDADKLDSYEAAAFPKLATDNTFTGANQVGTSSSDRVKLTAPTTGATPQVDSVITGGFNLALRNAGTGGRAYYFCATHDLYGSGGGRLILLDNTVSTGSAALTLLSGKFGFGVGNLAPTAVIDSNGDTIRLRASKTPASATATGNAGDICWDASYVYVCVATNTWKRVAISSW